VLNIHILNVGNGDSIVIEHIDNDENVSFGLIDSNIDKGTSPPALEKLKELGAKELSFISLTHPHWDHYTGLAEIFEYYKGKIDTFYSFPVTSYLPGRLSGIAKTYKKLIREAGTERKKRQFKEFVEIIVLATKHAKNWEEPTGFMTPIAPAGFNNVQFYVLLPSAKARGKYDKMVKSGKNDIAHVNNNSLNQLSMAFCLKYRGNEIVLAGDGAQVCWNEHIIKCSSTRNEISSNAVKLPHHGSNNDNTEKILNHFYAKTDEKYAVLSANGNKHPHPSTLRRLKNMKIDPYCTNLSSICQQTLVTNREILDEIEPKLRNSIINNLTNHHTTTPCQGDVKVSIDDSGVMDISSQTGNACPFRGSFDFLAD